MTTTHQTADHYRKGTQTMSTTRYLITDDVFRPDSLSSEHWVVQEGSHDVRRTTTPLVYDDWEEARDYVEYIRAAADTQKGHTVIDAISSDDFTVIFGTEGSIRVVRVVAFKVEEA